jgi:hypothetical protein
MICVGHIYSESAAFRLDELEARTGLESQDLYEALYDVLDVLEEAPARHREEGTQMLSTPTTWVRIVRAHGEDWAIVWEVTSFPGSIYIVAIEQTYSL